MSFTKNLDPDDGITDRPQGTTDDHSDMPPLPKRYIYYQMQDELGPVASSNPLYPSEPSVSRLRLPLFLPSTNLHTIIEHIFRAESINVDTDTRAFLYDAFNPEKCLGKDGRADIESKIGPGSSILRPFICVIINAKRLRRPPGWVTVRTKRDVQICDINTLKDGNKNVYWASNVPVTDGTSLNQRRMAILPLRPFERHVIWMKDYEIMSYEVPPSA